MRHIVTSAITATLVSLVCVLALQVTYEPQGTGPTAGSRIEEVAEGVERNLDSIIMLRSELFEIRNELSQHFTLFGRETGTDLSASPENELIARIELLEASIKNLSPTEMLSSSPNRDVIREQYIDSLRESNEIAASSQINLLESNFENDSGIPLGNYSELIGDTLHALDSIVIKGIDCRNTACKVTYSKTNSLESQEVSEERFELVDQLAQSAGGHDVDVRYAKDHFGNEVMYIQLR